MSSHPLARAIGSISHAALPLVIILAALVGHFIGKPLEAPYLIILLTAAYGKTTFHDYLQAKNAIPSAPEPVQAPPKNG